MKVERLSELFMSAYLYAVHGKRVKEPVKRSSGSGGGGGVLDATTSAITNPCCVLIQILPIKFYINNEVQSP